MLVVLLVLVVVGGGFWLRHRVQASLPRLSGELALPGLSAPVVAERDALGVPTLKAATRQDAARALGFVHAQDRFFQMDLLRREAAGEFAEFFGARLLMHDENRRLHHFRAQAARIVAGLPPEQRAVLEAYTAGVNAGLKSLGDKPFEYVVMRIEPRPWRPEDSILAIYAMFFTLNDWRALVEADLGDLHQHVPQSIYDFVVPAGSEWDAPLTGAALPTPPIPGPEVLDLRKAPTPAKRPRASWPRRPAVEETVPGWLEGWTGGDDVHGRAGSNWAVAAAIRGRPRPARQRHAPRHRRPQHLVPGLLDLARPDGCAERRATGVGAAPECRCSPPAAPAGSLGASPTASPTSPTWWTSTSIRRIPTCTGRRLVRGASGTPSRRSGSRASPTRATTRCRRSGAPFSGRRRTAARGAPSPGRPTSPAERTWGLFELEKAKTIDEAIATAQATGVPPQNFTVADSSGRVGWTIIGRLPAPRRLERPGAGLLGRRLAPLDGRLAPAEVPKVVDPPSGRIWTANNRIGRRRGAGAAGRRLLRPRAPRPADPRPPARPGAATPRDMLALQLDDRRSS